MFLEQFYRQQDQVVEVHRVERLERALVVGVDDGGGLFLGIACVFQGFGRQDQVVFFHEPIMFLISSTPSSPEYSFCMMSVIRALTSVSSKIEKPGL